MGSSIEVLSFFSLSGAEATAGDPFDEDTGAAVTLETWGGDDGRGERDGCSTVESASIGRDDDDPDEGTAGEVGDEDDERARGGTGGVGGVVDGPDDTEVVLLTDNDDIAGRVEGGSGGAGEDDDLDRGDALDDRGDRGDNISCDDTDADDLGDNTSCGGGADVGVGVDVGAAGGDGVDV